jgi:hypothetical protein
MDTKVGECPNVWFYRRNERFAADQYLFEDTINWGNHKDYGGGRSIMLAAIRVLFYLGIRTIYLLGCDFKMDNNYRYHFEQNRSDGSVKGNTETYKQLIERFKQLKPTFEQYGLQIFNCYSDSGLKTFPFISVEQAVKQASKQLPDVAHERTEGLYERQGILKQQKKEKEKREKREKREREKEKEKEKEKVIKK